MLIDPDPEVRCKLCGTVATLSQAIETGWYPSYLIAQPDGEYSDGDCTCERCGDLELVEVTGADDFVLGSSLFSPLTRP